MFWRFGLVFWLLPVTLLFLALALVGKFFWIVIPVLIIAAILSRAGRKHWSVPPYMHYVRHMPGKFPGRPSALEVLRQRYARGEIDGVTYDQMRERLAKDESAQ